MRFNLQGLPFVCLKHRPRFKRSLILNGWQAYKNLMLKPYALVVLPKCTSPVPPINTILNLSQLDIFPQVL